MSKDKNQKEDNNIKTADSGHYISYNEYLEALENYFEIYPKFFQDNATKGIFLLGVATGKLLSAQRKRFKTNKNLEPFWNSLHNLNLNRKRILKLQTEVVSKLKYYQNIMPYPKSLLQAVSKYIMKAGMNFDLSDLEISWCYSHGLASYNEITNKKLISLIETK